MLPIQVNNYFVILLEVWPCTCWEVRKQLVHLVQKLKLAGSLQHHRGNDLQSKNIIIVKAHFCAQTRTCRFLYILIVLAFGLLKKILASSITLFNIKLSPIPFVNRVQFQNKYDPVYNQVQSALLLKYRGWDHRSKRACVEAFENCFVCDLCFSKYSP